MGLYDREFAEQKPSAALRTSRILLHGARDLFVDRRQTSLEMVLPGYIQRKFRWIEHCKLRADR